MHSTPDNFLISEKEVWNSKEEIKGEGMKSAYIHRPHVFYLKCVQAQARASKKVDNSLLLEVTKNGADPGEYVAN
jgi:hypothetical protein